MTPAMVIPNLASQLLSEQYHIPDVITQIFKEASVTSKPGRVIAERTFLHACSGPSRTYIVLDALDECEEQLHRKEILRFLHVVRQRIDIHLFVTSREYPLDIKQAFEDVPQIKVEAQDEDIKQFLSQRITNNPISEIVDSKSKAQTIDAIANRAQKS